MKSLVADSTTLSFSGVSVPSPFRNSMSILSARLSACQPSAFQSTKVIEQEAMPLTVIPKLISTEAPVYPETLDFMRKRLEYTRIPQVVIKLQPHISHTRITCSIVEMRVGSAACPRVGRSFFVGWRKGACPHLNRTFVRILVRFCSGKAVGHGLEIRHARMRTPGTDQRGRPIRGRRTAGKERGTGAMPRLRRIASRQRNRLDGSANCGAPNPSAIARSRYAAAPSARSTCSPATRASRIVTRSPNYANRCCA